MCSDVFVQVQKLVSLFMVRTIIHAISRWSSLMFTFVPEWTCSIYARLNRFADQICLSKIHMFLHTLQSFGKSIEMSLYDAGDIF